MYRIFIVAFVGIVLVQQASAQSDVIIPSSTIDSALAAEDCSVTVDEAIENAESFVIDANLKMVVVPCWQAAYNEGSIVFTVDARHPNEAKIMQFRDWSHDKKTWETVRVLWNVEYRKEQKRIVTLKKFRSLTDCGAGGFYQWSSGDFRLIGFWQKEECDGTPFELEDPKWKIFPQ